MKFKDFALNRMVNQLTKLCQSELKIQTFPEIEIIDTMPNGITSFGYFDGVKIVVSAVDRHPVDVMGTLAHELVHWKQSQAGHELDGNDGSHSENQANAIAGIIMRKFGKMYPDYFLKSSS